MNAQRSIRLGYVSMLTLAAVLAGAAESRAQATKVPVGSRAQEKAKAKTTTVASLGAALVESADRLPVVASLLLYIAGQLRASQKKLRVATGWQTPPRRAGNNGPQLGQADALR